MQIEFCHIKTKQNITKTTTELYCFKKQYIPSVKSNLGQIIPVFKLLF